MLSERLARWQFWLLVHRLHSDVRADAHLGHPGHAAADLHVRARPRLGDSGTNSATLGAVDPSAQLCDLRLQHFISLRNGKPAGDDPWDAWTLEWATTSPPPSYNFETIPECTAADRCGT